MSGKTSDILTARAALVLPLNDRVTDRLPTLQLIRVQMPSSFTYQDVSIVDSSLLFLASSQFNTFALLKKSLHLSEYRYASI